jgi:hypothetical protein
MMVSERGAIGLPCVVLALVLLLCAQLVLLYAGKAYERELDFIRGQQLRQLCASIFLAKSEALQPAGEELCYEGMLQPGKLVVQATCQSRYSTDGQVNFLEVKASAADVGAVQHMCRLQVNFSTSLQKMAAASCLAARKLEGADYLSQAALYTSIEEVTLPEVSFLKGRCPNAVNQKTVEEEGFSSRFYYINTNSTLSLGSSKGLRGQTLLAKQGFITIPAGAQFPDRLVLISENGDITLGSNVKLSQALVMAKGTVTIGAGSSINGFVLANNIVLKGNVALTPDIGATASIATPAYVNP